MDKEQMISLFVGQNQENFEAQQLMMMKQELEQCSETTLQMLISTSFKSPTTILILAIVLGWDRFFLEDVGMGILKVITCYGCFVWWILDIISAKKRTQQFNYKKYRELMMFSK